MAIEFNPGGASSLDDAVKLRYESNADTNAFTDAEKDKLAGIQAGATAGADWDDITGKPVNLATTDDIVDARGSVVPRAVSSSATINAANHLGQMVISDASSPVTITLANDLPVNASGTILQAGSGSVTIALASGDPVVATGKEPVIAGAACAVQWVKTGAGVYVFGALSDAA